MRAETERDARDQRRVLDQHHVVRRTFEAYQRRVEAQYRALEPIFQRWHAQAEAVRRALSDVYLNALGGLTSARTSSAARWRIARELARHPGLVPGRFANPAVRRRLAEEAQARGGRTAVRRWLVEQVYPQAVIDAASYVERPQRIRLGREWLGDERARVVPIRPNDLACGDARRWFRQVIRTQAEALLAPRDRVTALGAAAIAVPGSVRDLLRFLAARGIRLTPRERALLAYLAQRKSSAEIAAALGTSPGAVRVARHALKRKLAHPAP